MRRLIKTVLAILLVAALVLAGAMALRRGKARLAKAPKLGPRPVLVRTAKAGPAQIRKTLAYLGRVTSFASVELAAQITQRVLEVTKDEGDPVRKEELLAKLDDREIRATIAATKSRTASLQAEQNALAQQVKASEFRTQSLEQDYRFRQKEWERDRKLREKGDISASDAEATHTRFLVAEGQYRASVAAGEALEAQIERVKAQIVETQKILEQLDVQLSYTRIAAPADGVVARRLVDAGDLAAPGKPLFEVEDTSLYRVTFDVPQDDLSEVEPSTPVEIQFRSRVVRAAVNRIFPRVNAARMARAEIDLKELPPNTRIGDYVPLEALLAEEQCNVAVPRSALMGAEGAQHVYVVKDGRLELREVAVGVQDTQRAEIRSGLDAGEAVARGSYLSLAQLAHGLRVKAMP